MYNHRNGRHLRRICLLIHSKLTLYPQRGVAQVFRILKCNTIIGNKYRQCEYRYIFYRQCSHHHYSQSRNLNDLITNAELYYQQSVIKNASLFATDRWNFKSYVPSELNNNNKRQFPNKPS